MNIQGHSALVTGAGSGLGEATARELARLGAKVALLDMNLANAEKVAAEINAAHGQGSALACQCDITNSESVTAAITKASAAHGRNFYEPTVLVDCDDSMEVYNEEINDLLQPLAKGKGRALKILRDDPVKGAVIEGLAEEIVGKYGNPAEDETAELLDWLDSQTKRSLVITFGGGINEVMREQVAAAGLNVPRVPR